jgi:hypothetical protein
MTTGALVVDCDGHILEPPDLWETYLEPAYRDRALRIRVGDDGFEQLLIDGRPSTIARRGQLATLGGMGKRVDEARELRERAMRGDVAPEEVRGIRPTPEQTYLGGAAFGTMDMKERVQLLDRREWRRRYSIRHLASCGRRSCSMPSSQARIAAPTTVGSPTSAATRADA